MKNTLSFTTIRNEGPFLLEWIAWQKMLGFDRVLVMFNDCTDRSPQLLRLLAKAGEIGIRRHSPDGDLPPQQFAYRACRSHPYVKDTEWMFISDVDEYLVIHKGDGSLSALLDNGDVAWKGMAIHWRIFGSNSIQHWQDGLMHRRFLNASDPGARQNNCVKTILRDPLDFGTLRAHNPRNWNGAGEWGQRGNYFVLSNRRRWAKYDPDSYAPNGTHRSDITHGDASVHHYILQSHEQYAHKRGTPSASLGHDRYTDGFFDKFNLNSTPNDDALKYRERFDREHARLCAIPGVMRLHHLCCADLVAAMCEKRGEDPTDDPRWQHHRAMAKSLPHPKATQPS